MSAYSALAYFGNVGGLQGFLLSIFPIITQIFAPNSFSAIFVRKNFTQRKKKNKQEGLREKIKYSTWEIYKRKLWFCKWLSMCYSKRYRSKTKKIAKGEDVLEKVLDVQVLFD